MQAYANYWARQFRMQYNFIPVVPHFFPICPELGLQTNTVVLHMLTLGFLLFLQYIHVVRMGRNCLCCCQSLKRTPSCVRQNVDLINCSSHCVNKLVYMVKDTNVVHGIKVLNEWALRSPVQHRLKTNNFPGILQAFRPRFAWRNYQALWTE